MTRRDDATDFMAELDRLKQAAEFEAAGIDPEALRVRQLDEVLADPESAPPPAVLPYFAWRGRLTSVSGARKRAAKSTTIGLGIAAVSRGADFLGQRTTRAKCLLAALDEPCGDAARRMHAFNADPAFTLIADEFGPAASVHRIIRAAETHQPQLLVVDALGDLLSRMGVNENANAEVRPVLAELRAFARRTGVAVVWLHHVTRSTGQSRGASAIEEIADQVLTISQDTEDSTLRRVEVEGRMGQTPFAFRLTESGLALVTSTPSVHERVLAVLRDHPGSSQRQVVELVKGRAETIRSAIGDLLSRGVVRREGSGPSTGLTISDDRAGISFLTSGPTRDPVASAPREPARNQGGPTPDPVPDHPTRTRVPFRGDAVRGRGAERTSIQNILATMPASSTRPHASSDRPSIGRRDGHTGEAA